MSAPTQNLFAEREKHPSVSFKDAPVGTSHTVTIREYPTQIQARNYDSGVLEFWDDGKPKMLIAVSVDLGGVQHSLYVTPGTALFKAISTAQTASGAEIAPGGKLTITFTHTVPAKNPRHHPVKQYSATYVPAAVFAAPATEASPVASVAPAATAVDPHPTAALPPGLTAEAVAALKAAGLM